MQHEKPGGTRSSRHEQSTIAEEHRELRALLERVSGNHDLRALVPLLETLQNILEHHFDHEEGEGGLHDIIGDAAPRFLPRLQMIFEEHREILRMVPDLLERMNAVLDGPVQALLDDTDALVKKLQAHDEAESELLTEALLTDIGESG
jgi:hypothetical protein